MLIKYVYWPVVRSDRSQGARYMRVSHVNYVLEEKAIIIFIFSEQRTEYIFLKRGLNIMLILCFVWNEWVGGRTFPRVTGGGLRFNSRQEKKRYPHITWKFSLFNVTPSRMKKCKPLKKESPERKIYKKPSDMLALFFLRNISCVR